MPCHRGNLYVLSVTMFLSYASWNVVAPFLPQFLEELGSGGDSLLRWSGIIYALPAIASILAQPLWAKVGDKYGRKPMVIRAGLSLFLIYFLMSICKSPLQFALLRFVNGALSGFTPASMTLIGTNTPPNEAPKAIAIAQSATALGSIAGPVIGHFLAVAFGYRGSMRVSGMAMLISTILVVLLVKEINKPRITEKTSVFQDTAESFRSPIMLSIMLAVFVAGTFGNATFSVLALHLPRILGNAPRWTVAFVFSLPAVAQSLFPLGWTRFGGRRGYGTAIQTGLAGVAAFTLLLTFAGNIWTFAALYFIAGVALASVGPSTGALISTRVREDFQGRAYGMQFAAGMLGAFLAPIAATNIAAAFGLQYTYTFLGIVFLAGALIFPFSARRWSSR